MGKVRGLRPRKQPRQQRAQRTVEAIVEAAAQVFERDGYARATTDRIAERAGVSIGSLYQYFPGKDALLVALAERHADAGVRRVRALLSAAGGAEQIHTVPIGEILQLFVEQLIELHRTQPRLHRLLFVEAPMPKGHHERLSGIEDELASEIATLLRRHPEVRAANLELAAWMLVHVTHGLVHDYIVHPPPTPVQRSEFVAELVAMLRNYLVR